MRWPLVTRKRYVRLLKKLRKVEAERNALLEMATKADDVIDPATGALVLTASEMKAIARKAMQGKR